MDLDKTLQERGNRYGRFADHARITQDLKKVVSAYPHADFANDQTEALDMIFHKIGRIVCGDPNYADSWRDIAGYAKLVSDRLEEDQADRPAGDDNIISVDTSGKTSSMNAEGYFSSGGRIQSKPWA